MIGVLENIGKVIKMEYLVYAITTKGKTRLVYQGKRPCDLSTLRERLLYQSVEFNETVSFKSNW